MTAVDCCRQLEELNVGGLHLHLGIQPVQYCAQPLMDNLADLLLTCPSALGKLHLAAVAVAGEAAVVAEAEAASEAQVAVAGVPVAAEVVVTDENKKPIMCDMTLKTVLLQTYSSSGLHSTIVLPRVVPKKTCLVFKKALCFELSEETTPLD